MNKQVQTKTVSVPTGIEPVRLDKFLASRNNLDLSRAFIQQIIANELVMVDGRAVAKNHKLKGGEQIVLHIPPPELPDLSPENIPLDIVYEDEYMAVVNKPAGLVVHPAPGNPDHTLVNALLYRFRELAPDDSAEGVRPGIIHRLDKDTSGLLIVAKEDKVARLLRQQLADRKITKLYTAVVCGHMPDDSGTIDLPVGRSIRDRKKMVVTHVHSREAITHYQVLEKFRLNDLLEVRLETGRTHQIRVHMAHMNRPILGDPDYGGRQKWLRGIMPRDRKTGAKLLALIARQALHARTLKFIHPITRKEISVTSDLPEDMRALIENLRADAG
jgi:23S rRNA pseudouridine1911/1915/1917 synthase